MTKPIPKQVTEYALDFEAFWLDYPARWSGTMGKWHKDGKYIAYQEWKKLKKQERAEALEYVRCEKKGEYVVDACRWLKRRKWHDYRDAPKKSKPKPKKIVKPVVDLRPICQQLYGSKTSKELNDLFETEGVFNRRYIRQELKRREGVL